MRISSYTVFVVGLIAMALSTVSPAQQGGPARIPRYLELLRTPAVREDLQLLDIQAKEIEKIAANRAEIMSVAMSEIDRLESPEKRREVYATFQQSIANAESAAAEVLFPLQRQRLVQIENQAMIRAGDIFAGLTHPFVIDTLKINETQMKVIRQRAEEADAKLQQRLEVLRKQEREAKEEARRHVLSALFDDQRKLYTDTIGDVVEIVQTNPLPSTARASKTQSDKKAQDDKKTQGDKK